MNLENPSLSLLTKLNELVKRFEHKLSLNQCLSSSDKKLLLFLLKFLFDIKISDREFWDLTEKNQNSFKKFIIDRFFKHEAGKSKDYESVYHDITVESDFDSDFSDADQEDISKNNSLNSKFKEITSVDNQIEKASKKRIFFNRNDSNNNFKPHNQKDLKLQRNFLK